MSLSLFKHKLNFIFIFIPITLLLTAYNASAQEGPWERIIAGETYALAFQTDGTLWAWGRNDFGQLGNGTFTDSTVPVQVDGNDWQEVDAGFRHTLAIKADGTLWSWGEAIRGPDLRSANSSSASNLPIQIGSEANWQNIGAGAGHSIALKSDGTMWAWGNNHWGQLGDGTGIDSRTPIQVGSETNWQSISVGESHAFAIKIDGTIWTWGRNDNWWGVLGLGDDDHRFVPVQLGTDTDWQSVITGADHTLAVKTNGQLWAWGNNINGQIGNGEGKTGQRTPLQITSDISWQSLATGGLHSLGADTAGTLWAWGGDYSGQLGAVSTYPQYIPVQPVWDASWQSVVAAASYSLGIKFDGTLWGWGRNQYGQLGDGTTIDKNRPVQTGGSE
jgi:alpha-tubulin suppressor-like RCC1 family protein